MLYQGIAAFALISLVTTVRDIALSVALDAGIADAASMAAVSCSAPATLQRCIQLLGELPPETVRMSAGVNVLITLLRACAPAVTDLRRDRVSIHLIFLSFY